MLRSFVLALLMLSLTCLVPCRAGEGPSDELLRFWSIPKRHAKLAPHPRLAISQEQLDKLPEKAKSSKVYPRIVAAAENGFVDTENPLSRYWILEQGLRMNGRLLSLAIQWHVTGNRKYLQCILATAKALKKFSAYGTGFELWDGQAALGLAMTYDIICRDLTKDQRQVLVKAGREFIHNWLRMTGKGDKAALGEKRAFWVDRISNWNPVCSAGPGMLALTMYEDIPESQLVLDRVFSTFRPIFEEMKKNGGAWVEGLGYWNWTIANVALFGISFERSTGTKHDAFRSEHFRNCLMFGSWFAPHHVPCGFGDNNGARFGFAQAVTARHLNDSNAYTFYRWYHSILEERDLARKDDPVDIFHELPLSLIMLDGKAPEPVPAIKGPSIHYPRQGWGMVADQWPSPKIYASVRGGEGSGDHIHADLLSWNGLIGGELMILNPTRAPKEPAGYYDRRFDIFDKSQASKNSLFVAGISAYSGKHPTNGFPKVHTRSFNLPGGPALLMDARDVFLYSGSRRRPKLVKRLFAVLGSDALLVLDRVESRMAVPVEARAYTQQKVTFGDTDVYLEGKSQKARMTFASNQPVILRKAVALITSGSETPPVMMRFQTVKKATSVTLASLLSAGPEKVNLQVAERNGEIEVRASTSRWRHDLKLTKTLEPLSTGVGK